MTYQAVGQKKDCSFCGGGSSLKKKGALTKGGLVVIRVLTMGRRSRGGEEFSKDHEEEKVEGALHLGGVPLLARKEGLKTEKERKGTGNDSMMKKSPAARTSCVHLRSVPRERVKEKDYQI